MADTDGDSARPGYSGRCTAACAYRIAFFPRAGQKLLTGQGAMTWKTDFKQPLFDDTQGFSLHAAKRCGAALNDSRWNNSAVARRHHRLRW